MPLPSFVESYEINAGRDTGCAGCGECPLYVTVTVKRGQPASEALVLAWLRGEAEAVAARLGAGLLRQSTPFSTGGQTGATFRFAGKA